MGHDERGWELERKDTEAVSLVPRLALWVSFLRGETLRVGIFSRTKGLNKSR